MDNKMKNRIKEEIDNFINGIDSSVIDDLTTEDFNENDLMTRIMNEELNLDGKQNKHISGRELAYLVGCGDVYDEAAFNVKMQSGSEDQDIIIDE